MALIIPSPPVPLKELILLKRQWDLERMGMSLCGIISIFCELFLNSRGLSLTALVNL